jgi:putative glycosyltransferase (TIGR04348 family)
MSRSTRSAPVAFLVTPGTREANNGNWRTARRWAGFLAGIATPIVQTEWDGEPVDVAIALHARRSAASIERLKAVRPDVPLVLVLSGTDLYRDLPASAEARRSLELADRIVALQDDAIGHVPREHRGKCEVIYQSSTRLAAARKPPGRLDCVAVGHLRDEKDPKTLWNALALLDPLLPIRVRHIGAPLDPGLGKRALAIMATDPRYRWNGALPHGLARAAIRKAHVLVHPSRMEGGANVIAEAITSGTCVVASRVSGNVGMLGPSYPGYFEAGDAAGLARVLAALVERPSALGALKRACEARRPAFSPARERRTLRTLVQGLLQAPGR